MNLQSLPDDILRDILSYSAPKQDCLKWEWAGTVGLTCKTIRRLSIELLAATPALSLELHQFEASRRRGLASIPDLRCNILHSLRDTGWMGAVLKELHVNRFVNNDVVKAIRSLLTTPGALPSLTWLDISVAFCTFPLVDSDLLSKMPAAMPKLTKLCFAECFKHDSEVVSPSQLKDFAESLESPLESLSLCSVRWMSDEHIAALLPVIGKTLTRLELFDCSVRLPLQHIQLSDASMAVIARECRRLHSFSIARTDVTSSGLAGILRANEGLRKLDLSDSKALGTETAKIIAMHASRLQSLRLYSCFGFGSNWLNDEGIKAMIDGQMEHSNGSGIYLETIGMKFVYAVTARGVRYALERGVHTIELSERSNIRDLKYDFPEAQFVRPAIKYCVDGSLFQNASKDR